MLKFKWFIDERLNCSLTLDFTLINYYSIKDATFNNFHLFTYLSLGEVQDFFRKGPGLKIGWYSFTHIGFD